ncbi:Ldh family oxidoreductase [Dactylosporangium sp. NPDC050688]|uniref:Ldh family oxidoreductase n=1 Tax=Dactylosporangium sp. NPDC050688 TaxID=3157217 RepID=UPI0033C9478A
MLVSVDRIADLMTDALRHRGFTAPDAELIVEDYLGAELEGRRTHGVGRFVVIDRYLDARAAAPAVVHDLAAVAVVDGNRGMGQLVCREATSIAIGKARVYGVGVVTARNFTRFSRLKIYAEQVARAGLIAVAVNCGGAPPLVPAPNTTRRVVGTNPIAFAFPRTGGLCSFDFATSEHAWGHVRQAVIDGTAVPPGFLDEEGRPVTDPARAASIRPAGGGKGFALGFAIEVLAGVLAGAELGVDQASHLDLGFVVIALDPAAFGVDTEAVMASVRRLSDQVASAPPVAADGPVPRAPGDGSKAAAAAARSGGVLDLRPVVLDKLLEMAAGRVAVDDLPKLVPADRRGPRVDRG